MAWLTSPEAWAALATLIALEVVLGIDNIIFISLLVNKLPEQQRAKARFIGLSIALVARIALLVSITWVMKLTGELFTVAGHAVSGRDLILFGGGLFLIYKSTHEIHDSMEGGEAEGSGRAISSFAAAVAQITLIDIIFSLDSVITAVGMAKDVEVMIIAVVIAVAVMMVASGRIAAFVDEHPTIKMLALAFLVLVGFALMGEGVGLHIPKGYIYFAMAFSFGVEMLNLRARKKRQTVKLHNPRREALEQDGAGD